MGESKQLDTPLSRHDCAGRILVGRQRIDETRRSILFVQTCQDTRQHVHLHALIIERNTNHFDTQRLVCVDGAGVAVLLHNHDIVSPLTQRLRNQSYRLHGTVRQHDPFRVHRNSFAVLLSFCHQPSQTLVPQITGVCVELHPVLTNRARCRLRQLLDWKSLRVGGPGTEVHGVHHSTASLKAQSAIWRENHSEEVTLCPEDSLSVAQASLTALQQLWICSSLVFRNACQAAPLSTFSTFANQGPKNSTPRTKPLGTLKPTWVATIRERAFPPMILRAGTVSEEKEKIIGTPFVRHGHWMMPNHNIPYTDEWFVRSRQRST